jgi:alpha-L-rhamnosidase
VELTGVESPPTLDMLEAVNVRSSVEPNGDLSFSDDMLQKVHHNILYGQADNLMMVPTDCDNRDERFGWTGDSALTADEAALNFDLSSFYRNWLQMLDDSSQNGAISCWVPGGKGHASPGAGSGCDASWQSAYPSVAFALMHWYGDLDAPAAHWKGLTRWMDNSYAQAKGDVTKIKTGPGDWCPPPAISDSPFKPEPKVSGIFSSGFSYLRDMRNMIAMAEAIGETADATRYRAWYAESLAAFHTHWWSTTEHVYEKGGQAAHSLALELDCMPSAAIKQQVVDGLVANIVTAHTNHTTTGIIGWRFEPDVLSANGHGDVAYALLTQRTYPSIGYEILSSSEPATTLWEKVKLW